MSSYHGSLKVRQQAQEQARVKSILIFAETLKKRRPIGDVQHILAVKRVSELIRAKTALAQHYGREKGRAVK